MGALRSAMVSLWKHRTSHEADNFLGSGVFIARATILTVRHIVAQHDPLFVLCHGKVVAHEVSRVESHPDREIDVAVVWLRDHPPDTRTVSVEVSVLSTGQKVWVGGYFEREYEPPAETSVTQYVAEDRHYLIDRKQPKGYSGSPVTVGERVLGVACRHYEDSNTHRGCFIAVDQFANWLATHVPSAVMPARPSDTPVPGQREELQRMAADKLRRCFSARPFDNKFPAELVKREGAVPLRIAEALREEGDDIGLAVVQGVLDLSRDLGALLEDDSVSLTPKEKDNLKDKLKEAMGWACRLCIGANAAGYVSMRDLVNHDVAMDFPPGATLLFEQTRHQSWAVTDQAGLRTLKDEHAVLPGIELGEGDDVKRGITKAMAASFSVTGQFSGEVDSRLENLLRGKARGAAADGKARYVVLEKGKNTPFNPEMRQWIRSTLGVGCIELTGFDDMRGLLTVDEGVLLDRVTCLLELFAEPEWN